MKHRVVTIAAVAAVAGWIVRKIKGQSVGSPPASGGKSRDSGSDLGDAMASELKLDDDSRT